MKAKHLLFIIIGIIIVIMGYFVFDFYYWYYTDDSYYNFMGTYRALQNTSVQKYLVENNPNEFITTETIKSKEVKEYLAKTGYLENCPNISKSDFSIFYDNNSILVINARTFEVECDYVRSIAK